MIYKKNERIIGIDLLRLLSMFMVVLLHILGHGGIIGNIDAMTWKGDVVALVNILCYPAVDIFILITGYVYAEKSIKIGHIIQLWLKVVFYSFLFELLIQVYNSSLDVKSLVFSCFPVLRGVYWFFSAYIGLFIFIPFINKMIKNITQREYTILLCCCGGINLLSIVGSLAGNNIYDLNRGYSVIWFIILYLVGAYIKKFSYSFICSKWINIIVYLFFLFVAFVGDKVIKWRTQAIYGENRYGELVISYTSPLIWGQAICLVLIFLQINIKREKLKRRITNIASSAFGVYLISDNPIVRETFIFNKFAVYTDGLFIELIVRVVIFSSLIYVLCLLMDYLISKLLNKINIYEFEIWQKI